jgi:acetyl/propionyl-CoA carboxylase alpha subunit
MVTGLDLVELQLMVAAGDPLPPAALQVSTSGHAVEVRLCAEDPYHDYLGSSGTFDRIEFPEIDGLRIDSGVVTGSVVSPYYDSMVAKLIAHAPTRRGAISKLRRALGTATLIGPVTNRNQLLALLDSFDTDWADIDTGWLDRHGSPAAPPTDPAFVAAAGLAWVRHQRDQRRVLPGVPQSWRNNASQQQSVAIGEHVVDFRHDRNGGLTHLGVDGVPVSEGWMPAIGFIETDVVGEPGAETVYVSRGLYRFAVPPRFPLPDDAGRSGSLVAPMPGSVVRILVVVGDRVVAGQPLVAIEAMKMEHQVVSPTDGVVAEVLVAPGQHLDSGQPLLRIEAAAATDEP